MLFTYPGKASETTLSALDVSNNSVMEIKRLQTHIARDGISTVFSLCFQANSSTAEGQTGQSKGTVRWGQGVSPVVPMKTQLCWL